MDRAMLHDFGHSLGLYHHGSKCKVTTTIMEQWPGVCGSESCASNGLKSMDQNAVRFLYGP